MALKTVALPTEHGGWGLLLEPLVVGVAAAPSGAGFAVAGAALAAFLMRHPLKLVASDIIARRRTPRTARALAFAVGYAAAGLLCLTAAVRLSGASLLLPAVIVAPLALTQLGFDVRNRSRGLVPEICGSLALAASAACIGLAAGWPPAPAATLSAVTAARTLPAVLTVRAQVLRLRGADASPVSPSVAQAAALVAVAALAVVDAVPVRLVWIWAALTARGLWSLHGRVRHVRPQRIGIEELLVGLMVALVSGLLLSGHQARISAATISTTAARPARGYAVAPAASMVNTVTTNARGPIGHSNPSTMRSRSRSSVNRRPTSAPTR
ncbi:MAG: YwiC-like family protein [Acidobacteria bacterium]|nr:YwiC-like family protein [Acidobacteriota bacterium]